MLVRVRRIPTPYSKVSKRKDLTKTDGKLVMSSKARHNQTIESLEIKQLARAYQKKQNKID